MTLTVTCVDYRCCRRHGGLGGCVLLHWQAVCNGFLVSASADMTIKLWDPSKHWEMKTETNHHTAQVNMIVPYEETLITCSHDRTIKIYHINEEGMAQRFTWEVRQVTVVLPNPVLPWW